MIKKLFKYGKIAVALTLIAALTLPSYATVGASDGSAFVTKAEFDAALSDFNARLTTFEAGINSKIDSQVSSYLDRNGIWNGADQTLVNPKRSFWLPSTFEIPFVNVKTYIDSMEPGDKSLNQQKMWEIKREILNPGAVDEVTTYKLEPKVGYWSSATTENNTKNYTFVTPQLSNRKSDADLVLELSKSGALFLDIDWQRIINNQTFTHTNGYGRLYAATDFLDSYNAGNTNDRLTQHHNLFDPTSPNYDSFAGDSAMYILPGEDWLRAYSIACNTEIVLSLDDKPAATYNGGVIIPPGMFPFTHNLNNLTTDDPFNPGGDSVTTLTDINGITYNMHYSFGFGLGFPMMSTEPQGFNAMIFCTKGQKLSIAFNDIFSGRNWKTYTCSLYNAESQGLNNPDRSLNDFDPVANQWKSSIKNGYFVNVVGAKVY